MRFLRQRKHSLLACGFVLCVIVWIHQFSNVFDFVWYYAWPERYALPLSLHCNQGRLGNQMCTYATLYGLSALNNRRRFVALACNTANLKSIFDGPSKVHSLRSFLYLKRNPWELQPFLKPNDSDIPSNSNFMNGYRYPCSYTFFDHVKDEIRREFQFKDELKKHAQTVLLKSNVHDLHNVTYVGVHVRRGDYQKKWLEVFEGVPVNMKYFRKALHYFRSKYKNVVFIAVSEDRLWCIKHLSGKFGVYVPEEAPSAAHDLAVLASCNHTVLTYGTFGFWGAYLAGGEVIYFDKFLKPNTTFTLNNFVFDKMYPPYWKGIVTVNSSYWIQKSNGGVKAKLSR